MVTTTGRARWRGGERSWLGSPLCRVRLRRRGILRLAGGGGLDGGGEDALDADAVAAHDGRDFLAVGVEDAWRPWTSEYL